MIINNQPLVSVNMVVYNGERFISEAIQSILSQTYFNIELIIVNDASTDSTKKIIHSFNDDRIYYHENSKNMGECKSRIIALNLSSGKYVAVMDADDVSMPNRLTKQVEFLEENLDFGLVGSLAKVIDKKGNSTGIIHGRYFSNEMTMVYLFFKNCFTHSSFLFRKNILDKVGINKNKPLAVDYETAVKISRISKICNLNEALVKYRQHGENMLEKFKNDLEKNVKEILEYQIRELNISPTSKELDVHYKLKKGISHIVNNRYFITLDWLNKLYVANRNLIIFPPFEFSNYISGYWFNYINNPNRFTFKLIIPYFNSPILRNSNRNLLDHIKYFLKCIIYYKKRN